jgi:hypothetical protein
MLRSFIEADVYRVMLGCESRELLLAGVRGQKLEPEGSVRCMRRDDGSGVYVVTLFADGGSLERLALHGELLLMQVDNISARLRAVPTLPGAGEYVGGYSYRQCGYAA